jgi:V/A-type H+-transporting ATPase subunit E
VSEARESIIARITSDVESDASSTIETAKRVADRELTSAQRRLRTRERRAEADLDKMISARLAEAKASVEADARRLRLEGRHRLAERLLAETLAALASMPRDDAYFAALERLLVQAAETLGAGEAVAKVCATDLDFLSQRGRFEQLAAKANAATGLTLTLSREPVDTSGGVVLSTNDGKISVFNTFEEIANRRIDRIRQLVSEELTGQ